MSQQEFLAAYKEFHAQMFQHYSTKWSDGSAQDVQTSARAWMPPLFKAGCTIERLKGGLAQELCNYFKDRVPTVEQAVALISGQQVVAFNKPIYHDPLYQEVSDMLIGFRKDYTAGNIRMDWNEAEHKSSVDHWAETLIEFEIKDPYLVERARKVVRQNVKKYSSFAPKPLEFVGICQDLEGIDDTPEAAVLSEMFDYFGICYGGKYISKDASVRAQYVSAWEKELDNYGMCKAEYIKAGLISLKSNLRFAKRALTPVEIAEVVVTSVHTEIPNADEALQIAIGVTKVENPHPLVYHSARQVGHHRLKTSEDSYAINEFKNTYRENLLKVISGDLKLKAHKVVAKQQVEDPQEEIADKKVASARLRKLFN